jgi:hypothetical protein
VRRVGGGLQNELIWNSHSKTDTALILLRYSKCARFLPELFADVQGEMAKGFGEFRAISRVADSSFSPRQGFIAICNRRWNRKNNKFSAGSKAAAKTRRSNQRAQCLIEWVETGSAPGASRPAVLYLLRVEGP